MGSAMAARAWVWISYSGGTVPLLPRRLRPRRWHEPQLEAQPASLAAHAFGGGAAQAAVAAATGYRSAAHAARQFEAECQAASLSRELIPVSELKNFVLR